MFKYILENAGDINWMAIFALLTFFAVFLIGTVTVLRRDRQFIDRMAHLPLDDNHQSITTETETNHEK